MQNTRHAARLCRIQRWRQFLITSRRYCQNSSDEDSSKSPSPTNINEEKNKEDVERRSQKKEAAKLKMNELLQSLTKIPQNAKEIPIFHPEPRKKKPDERKASLGKDAGDTWKETKIDPVMKRAVKEVAQSIGGEVTETETELLASLRSQASSKTLSELLVGMKIDRSSKSSEKSSEKEMNYTRLNKLKPVSRLREFRNEKLGKKESGFRYQKTINVFGASPLYIFPTPSEVQYEGKESILPTWDNILKSEMKFAVTYSPRNSFEEMIRWTEQGKLWQFPIDNEFGFEEEKAFSFGDHIFLEHHLEGWCPAKGPIRHFMELVCNGLSKNPFITVQRKQAHINWYKEYFEQKRDLLKEVGATP